MIPFLIDADGTQTDGTVIYPGMGRKFNLRDGHGIGILRNRTNVTPVIISGEDDQSIRDRGRKLDVVCVLGVRDKYKFVSEQLLESIYIAISDDIPDLELLKNATLAFCPADAEEQVKAVDGIIVLTKKGGEGCVREAINMILTQPWIKELFKGALQIT